MTAPSEPDNSLDGILTRIRAAREIVDRAIPFAANIAQRDTTALRTAAFSIVLRELLGDKSFGERTRTGKES